MTLQRQQELDVVWKARLAGQTVQWAVRGQFDPQWHDWVDGEAETEPMLCDPCFDWRVKPVLKEWWVVEDGSLGFAYRNREAACVFQRSHPHPTTITHVRSVEAEAVEGQP